MRRIIGLVGFTSALLFAWTGDVSARGGCGGGRHGGRHHGCCDMGCCSSCGGCYSCGGCSSCGSCGAWGGGCPGGVCPMPGGGHHAALAMPATLVVQVPANAVLTVDGQATTSTSGVRTFQTPSLEPGYDYSYAVQVRVGDEVVTQQVTVRAGEQTRVRIDMPGVAVTQR